MNICNRQNILLTKQENAKPKRKMDKGYDHGIHVTCLGLKPLLAPSYMGHC